MSILRFYDRFAAAYGTCWLVLSFPAFSGGRIHITRLGFYGFVAISVGYAVVRTVNEAINRLYGSGDSSQFDDARSRPHTPT